MEVRREQLQKLGFNIARIREEKGISQADLVRMLGYSGHGYLSRVENGEQAPSIKLLLSVSQILDVPAADFFEGV